MTKKIYDNDQFIKDFRELGAAETAKLYGMSERCVHLARRRIENRTGVEILSPRGPGGSNQTVWVPTYPMWLEESISDAEIAVGSDAHYWPGDATLAHTAFCHLIKERKPKIIILNGDVLDGASISRHARIRWEKRPSLKEELEVVSERLDEIKKSSPESKRYWILGNHCSRFETKLAAMAGEFEDVKGFRLSDHFPDWTFAMGLMINHDIAVKHRFKGGVHATHNNALWSGRTMVTGHLHSLKTTPFSDYNGTRYGVDTGTLSEPNGEHAAYAEGNPLNHRSGFAWLTIREHTLMSPELILCENGRAQFRGDFLKV